MSAKKQTYFRTLLSFLLPVAILSIIYAILGIYPWGPKTILTIDMNNQYVSILSYLREIMLGNRDFFYSFSKTLGGDMAGLNAYYLMSPLNLLLLLFSTENLPLGIELLTLIKIGLCGMTFYLCVTGRRNGAGILFSTAYALMAYNMIYQQNIMWLDSVILLPAVALGICRITEKRSPFLYLFALFGTVVTNYYIGFMVCIFSVLFFLYQYFGEKRKKQLDFSVIGNFAAASLLGGGMGMWIILPAVLSLRGGKASFQLSSLVSLEKVFPLRDFLIKFFIGSADYGQVVTGKPEQYIPLPNVYCGMLTLVFAGLFFLNRKISARKKIGMLLLLAVLLLSFYLKGLNMIWHGFNEPVWFPYRFSFLFSFLLLYMGWEGFCQAKTASGFRLIGAVILVCGLMTASLPVIWNRPYAFISAGKYLVSIFVAVMGAFLFVVYVRTNRKRFLVLLTGICCAELLLNGVLTLQNFYYQDLGEYQIFVKETEPAVKAIEKQDKGFYRMEKTFVRTKCDPMLLNYKGLSHYSSSEKSQVKYFMGQMGFRNQGIWSYYNRGSSYAADCLLGVKYLCTKSKFGQPYKFVKTVGPVNIYENPYALGIGFLADASVLDCSIDSPHKFQLQNELWKSLHHKIEKDLFVPEDLSELQLINLKQSEDDPNTYEKTDREKEAAVVYTFTAKTENPVFAWFGTESMQGAQILVNGNNIGRYFEANYYDILRLGSFKKGEEVTIEICPATDRLNLTDAWVYHQDMNVMKEYYEALSQGEVKFTEVSDTRISGTIDSNGQKEYLFFTIPIDPGWHVFVDGKEESLNVAMGIFSAVKIPSGIHQIELKFIAPGLHAGVLVSGISVVLVFAWMLQRKRKCRCLERRS